jgi:hypothetical protein
VIVFRCWFLTGKFYPSVEIVMLNLTGYEHCVYLNRYIRLKVRNFVLKFIYIGFITEEKKVLSEGSIWISFLAFLNFPSPFCMN